MLLVLTVAVAIFAVCAVMMATLILVTMHRRFPIRLMFAVALIGAALNQSDVLRHIYQDASLRADILQTHLIVFEYVRALALLTLCILWLQDLHREVTEDAPVGPPPTIP